jgi:hypothetical protein
MVAKNATRVTRPQAAATDERPEPSDGEFEILRLTTTGTEAQKRVPVFTIDDEEYTVWVNPGPAWGLRCLKVVRENGQAAAVQFAMEELLGPEAYEALSSHDELTEDELGQVIGIVTRIMAGAAEGKARGPRRSSNGRRK